MKDCVVFWSDYTTKKWGHGTKWMSVSEARAISEEMNQLRSTIHYRPCHKNSLATLIMNNSDLSRDEAQAIVDKIQE